MTQEPTQKQRDFLSSLVSNKRNRRMTEGLDFIAQDKFGFDHWDDAPLSKRVVSCLIDIYLGKADAGLFVWAVRQELEAAA